MQSLHEHDTVVLLENTPATHYRTKQAIMLPRGCSGTIIDDTIGEFVLVEFADTNGRAFAIEAIAAVHLIALVHEPLLADLAA